MALIAILGLLGGCAEWQTGKAVALDKGAEIADEALGGAILIKCRGSRVGAIQRRYMGTDEAWRLWTDECLGARAVELPDFRADTLPPQ